jgi:hypothetical protein
VHDQRLRERGDEDRSLSFSAFLCVTSRNSALKKTSKRRERRERRGPQSYAERR